jgi:hypothetical protein
MANKMTQRNFFEEVIAMAKENGRDDLAEFAQGRIEVLDKKSENRKPSKTQAENEVLKGVIVDVLTENGGQMTVTEMLNSGAFDAMVTNQKVTALLRQLVESGKVEKVVDKKKSFFKAIV